MGRALIYARHRNALALEAQVRICRAWCDKSGHEVVRVREEIGSMTALELAHSELELDTPDFDLIVAAAPDRYSRGAKGILFLRDQAAERGVGLFTADGIELTSDAYRSRLALVAGIIPEGREKGGWQ